jgi:hypothetical protein
MTRSAVLAIFITGCYLLSGCSNTPQQSPMQLLTDGSSKKWKLTGETLQGKEIPLEPCLADNRLVLSKDGQWSVEDGGVRCSPADTGRSQGTWKINPEGTQLTLGPQKPISLRIKELSDSSLVVEMLDRKGVGIDDINSYRAVR